MQLNSLQAATGVKEASLLMSSHVSVSHHVVISVGAAVCGNNRLELAFVTFGIQTGCYQVSKGMDAFEIKSATSQVASSSLLRFSP